MQQDLLGQIIGRTQKGKAPSNENAPLEEYMPENKPAPIGHPDGVEHFEAGYVANDPAEVLVGVPPEVEYEKLLSTLPESLRQQVLDEMRGKTQTQVQSTEQNTERRGTAGSSSASTHGLSN
jgi:hypothetical protein